jgi:hypothetical protein
MPPRLPRGVMDMIHHRVGTRGACGIESRARLEIRMWEHGPFVTRNMVDERFHKRHGPRGVEDRHRSRHPSPPRPEQSHRDAVDEPSTCRESSLMRNQGGIIQPPRLLAHRKDTGFHGGEWKLRDAQARGWNHIDHVCEWFERFDIHIDGDTTIRQHNAVPSKIHSLMHISTPVICRAVLGMQGITDATKRRVVPYPVRHLRIPST